MKKIIILFVYAILFGLPAFAQKIPTGKYVESNQYLSASIEFENGKFTMCPLSKIPINPSNGISIRDVMFSDFPAHNWSVWGTYTSSKGKVTLTVTGTDAAVKKTYWAGVKKTYTGRYYDDSQGHRRLVMDNDGTDLYLTGPNAYSPEAMEAQRKAEEEAARLAEEKRKREAEEAAAIERAYQSASPDSPLKIDFTFKAEEQAISNELAKNGYNTMNATQKSLKYVLTPTQSKDGKFRNGLYILRLNGCFIPANLEKGEKKFIKGKENTDFSILVNGSIYAYLPPVFKDAVKEQKDGYLATTSSGFVPGGPEQIAELVKEGKYLILPGFEVTNGAIRLICYNWGTGKDQGYVFPNSMELYYIGASDSENK